MKLTIELSPEQVEEIAKAMARYVGHPGKPLTVVEFAKSVGESDRTIRRKIEAGLIVKIDRPGDTRISRAELDRYCAGKPLPK